MNRFLNIFVLSLLLALSQPVLADKWSSGFRGERPAQSQGRGISANEAANRVQQSLGGRILAVITVQKKGRTFYRVKILTARGVVKVVNVDASRGRR